MINYDTDEVLHYSRGLVKAVEIVRSKMTKTADVRIVLEILTDLTGEIKTAKENMDK
jgi:hypothetical protein